jgi:xanthine dehydrogenase YagS FAD-binding subunit
MKTIAYMTAQSAESARAAVRANGAYYAGGIDLLGELKEYLTDPDVLVNVKSLPGTNAISNENGKWVIGANVTVAALAADSGIRAGLPGLAEAAEEVASPQIRNVARIGGNLAQHSRCWYYRHRDIQCLKNGGARCYAREGESRYHSIFTGNPCISPVVSNLAIALAALDARAIVLRDRGEQSWRMAELYQNAWENPLAQNSLSRGDLILRVEVPEPPKAARSTYLQLSQKSDFDWALVSCAAAAEVEGGTLRNPRLVLGVVSPMPHESEAANAHLNGKRLDETVAEAAAALLLEGATTRPDNAYKIPMATALIKRALLRLVA